MRDGSAIAVRRDGPELSGPSKAERCEGLAASLERIFTVDQSHSLELTSAEWEARDIYRRFTEFVLNPLRPLL